MERVLLAEIESQHEKAQDALIRMALRLGEACDDQASTFYVLRQIEAATTALAAVREKLLPTLNRHAYACAQRLEDVNDYVDEDGD